MTSDDPSLAAGELRNAILGATEAIGWTLIPGGVSADALPISLNWGADNKLVFDALADQPSGPEDVHLFVYDLATGIATHIAGPFAESNTNNHNYSLLTPRWIP